ncbi:DUF2007 domain-containing protein [bacterium]|nr:DUF2007 domain-containing protein [bacterium]
MGLFKSLLSLFSGTAAPCPISSEAINSSAEASVSDDPIEIARYTMLQDADFARMELQSEGIDAVIMDDAVSAWAPYYTYMTGIRLFVPGVDASRAVQILKSIQEQPKIQA